MKKNSKGIDLPDLKTMLSLDTLSDDTDDPPGLALKNKGIYYITGGIFEDSLLEIHQDILLKHLDPTWNDDIQIIVNSVGGYSSEGWAFIDLLDWIKMDIRTVGLGDCSSLGAMILASGTPGKRQGSKNLSVMIHGAWIGDLSGNINQLVAQMKSVQDEHNRMIRFWIERSKYKNEEQIKKEFLTGVDQYFTAQEALSHGIIDNIIEPRKKIRKKK